MGSQLDDGPEGNAIVGWREGGRPILRGPRGVHFRIGRLRYLLPVWPGSTMGHQAITAGEFWVHCHGQTQPAQEGYRPAFGFLTLVDGMHSIPKGPEEIVEALAGVYGPSCKFSCWRARRDSNPQPLGPKPNATRLTRSRQIRFRTEVRSCPRRFPS